MPDPAEPYFYVDPPSSNFAARCAERFQAWRKKRRWVSEMSNAAALGRLDNILEDVGMTRAELDELAAAPADAGRQFEKMAAIEGLDLDTLPAHAVREAMWKCTRCASRKECKRWLRTGVWQYDGDPRCPNAALFDHH
jgi:uncharacterized protein YjiS (DUF1127 family)